ncbi:hypothetical protein FACUT_1427 [Fusarium acutatum]|uniref:Uncharacterized protein n=1 Tax=Fusarium acutatum TaxID=78861 RepID=A0A8H4NQ06_9HYPO|nr:hypothetical protein FACUT_1427 [Fusarium acutatum]
MSPHIRFLASYTPAVLPRLSIFQQGDEEGLDSGSESEQEEEETQSDSKNENSDSDSDEESDEESESESEEESEENLENDSNSSSEGFPVGLSDNGSDGLDFVTFANDDDGSGDDTKNDNIDDDAVPEKVCGQLTRRLVTAIHKAQHAANDVEAFTESRSRYTIQACDQLHQDVSNLGDKYLDAENTLHDKNLLVGADAQGYRRIRSLVSLLGDSIFGLQRLVSDLQDRIGPPGKPSHDMVPTIALRTVRLWNILNTKDSRKEVLALGKSQVKLFIDKVATMINVDNPDNELTPHRTRKLIKGHGVVQSVTPYIYHLCLGSGFAEDGKGFLIHKHAHWGDSKEQLGSWPEFHAIRLAARDAHIGAEYAEDCLKFYQGLEELEQGANEVGLDTAFVRKSLSQFALKGIPAPVTVSALPAWSKLENPLRDVGQHVGRAFMDRNGIIEIVGCCYGCKASVRFDEAMEPDEFEKNIAFEAKEFKLEKRLKKAHSCAEVVSSHYCCMKSVK